MRIAVLAPRSLQGTGFATRVGTMLEEYASIGHEVDLFHFRRPNEAPLPGRVAAKLRRYEQVELTPSRLRMHAALMPPLAWQCIHAHRRSGAIAMAYDVVQAETPNVWSIARGYHGGKRLVVMHDDDGQRLTSLADLSTSLAVRVQRKVLVRKVERWQRIALREADRIWFASELDRDRLMPSAGLGKSCVIPNGAADELLRVPSLDRSSAVVLIVAPASYEANSHGLSWFLEQVWPLVRNSVDTASLRVVGVGWDTFGHHPAVSFVGWRDSLVEEYAQSRVVIAPMFAGGGTKLKVLEAMAAARPVVATPVAAAGVPVAAGLNVCREPRPFAERVAFFLRDVAAARNAGASNREAVCGFTWSAIWSEAVDDLELLVRDE